MAILSLTSREIARSIAGKRKVSEDEVQKIIAIFLERINEALAAGLGVQCIGLGSFAPRMRRKHIGVKFTMSGKLRERVQELLKE